MIKYVLYVIACMYCIVPSSQSMSTFLTFSKSKSSLFAKCNILGLLIFIEGKKSGNKH